MSRSNLTPIEQFLKNPSVNGGSPGYVNVPVLHPVSLSNLTLVYEKIEYNELLNTIVKEAKDNLYNNFFLNPKIVPRVVVLINENTIDIQSNTIFPINNILFKQETYTVEGTRKEEIIPLPAPVAYLTALGAGENAYQDERKTGGKHAIGAKIITYSSLHFQVEILNVKEKKAYNQIYEDHSRIIHPPSILDYNGKENLFHFRAILDTDLTKGKINNDMILVFFRMFMELQSMRGGEVIFNEVSIKIDTFLNLTRLLYTSDYTYVIESSSRGLSNYIVVKDNQVNLKPNQITYVNGLYLSNQSFLSSIFMHNIFDSYSSLFRDKYQYDLKFEDFKSKIMIFYNVHVINPHFPTQIKQNMDSADQYLSLSKEDTLRFAEEAMSWPLTSSLVILYDKRMKKTLNNSKLNDVELGSKRYSPSNNSFNRSGKSILLVCEGKSAKKKLDSIIMKKLEISIGDVNYQGRNEIGTFSIVGTTMSGYKSGYEKIMDNKNGELYELFTICNLNPKIIYEHLPNPYQHLCIIADNDLEALEIRRILMSTIIHFFPKLIDLGFLNIAIVPCAALYQNRKLNKSQFIQYYINDDDIPISIPSNQYITMYKGVLSIPDQLALDSIGMHIKQLYRTPLTEEYIKITSDRNFSDERKDIIDQSIELCKNNTTFSSGFGTMSYDEYVTQHYPHYMIQKMYDSIPHSADLLLPSSRKIVDMLHNLFKTSNKEKDIRNCTAYIKEHNLYRHRQDILVTVMSTMGKFRIGLSVNFPFLEMGDDNPYVNEKDDGSSQKEGTVDYLKVAPTLDPLTGEKMVDLYYPSILYDILEKEVGYNGSLIEPKFFIPCVFPLYNANVFKRLAPGYSSVIPPIVNGAELTIAMIRYQSPPPIIPGFKFWKGVITEEDGGWVTDVSGNVESTYLSHHSNKRRIIINSFPINHTFEEQKKDLDVLLSENKISDLIIDTLNGPGNKYISFKTDQFEPKLITTSKISSNNMHLINKDGYCVKYDTLSDMFQYWFHTYPEKAFILWKDREISKKEEEIFKISSRIRYVDMVRNEMLVAHQMTSLEFNSKMDEMGMWRDGDGDGRYSYLLTTKTFTDAVDKLKKDGLNMEIELEEIIEKSHRQTWLEHALKVQNAFEAYFNELERKYYFRSLPPSGTRIISTPQSKRPRK